MTNDSSTPKLSGLGVDDVYLSLQVYANQYLLCEH